MTYIQYFEHFINYVRKIYKNNGWEFTLSVYELLLNFYLWSDNYTNNKATDYFTWTFGNKPQRINKNYCEKIKKDFRERLIGTQNSKDGVFTHLFSSTISKLINKHGVYFLYNKQKQIIYIGKSKDLSTRIITSIKERADSYPFFIRILKTKTFADASVLETYFICKEKPSCNSESATLDDLTITVSGIPDKGKYIKIYKDL